MADNKPHKEEYTKMYEVEDSHWWYKGLQAYLFPTVEKLKPSAILDAGCGTGFNMLHFQNSGFNISGIDFSEDSIKFCKKRNLKNVIQGEIQKLPYSEESFDLIYSLDVLGCLYDNDAKQAIKEFNRCLKSDGTLILNVAALQYLFSNQDIAWHIKKRYSLNELAELLQENGFEIQKQNYRLFFLFPLVLVTKLGHKIKIKLTGDKNVHSDTDKTNSILNYLFTPIMKFEVWFSQFISYPFGSSAFIIAKKVS